MITDLKPYAEYKESGLPWLGRVPGHWEVRRLRASITDCVNGIWGADPNGKDDLICVRVADFDRVSLRASLRKKTVRAIPLSARSRRLLKRGDLLLEKSGGGELQPVGAVVAFDHDKPAVCSNFVARMPLAAGYDTFYVNYLHSTLYAYRINVRSIKQTTGIQNLDGKAYLAESVAFPPPDEQAAIVRFLDWANGRLERAIRAKRKVIALLNEQKQAIIHRAVTRGLHPDVPPKPSGIPWLGDIPKHWDMRKLRQILTRKTERNQPNLPLLSVVREKGVIKRDTENFEENHNFIPDDLSNYKVVRVGQFAMNKMKAWQGSFGVSQFEGIVSPAYFVFDLHHVGGAFFHTAIRSKAYVPSFTRASDGVRVGQWDLAESRMRDTPFFVPPSDEQQAIVEYVAKATETANTAIARTTHAASMPQSLNKTAGPQTSPF